MNILIDGHNLIGQMPGISLEDPDDEAKLVAVLRNYALANHGRSMTVVFDHGVYGHPLKLGGYGVTCYFAKSPQDADTQLIRRINAIQRPSEWRVVTSDRVVARAATDRNVRVTSSSDFARELTVPPKPRSSTSEKPRDVRLSAAEINEWLRLFGEEPEPTSEPSPPVAPPPTPKRRVQKKRVRKK